MAEGRILPDGSMNVLEEFVHDRAFEEFIDYYCADKFADSEVELILNGDFLDSIQVPFRGEYTAVLTESVCTEKVAACINGHPKVFSALKKFCSMPNNHIKYLIGNHDVDMLWQNCQKLFCDSVGSEVEFFVHQYIFDGFLIEHGQQFEAINSIEMDRLFLSRGLKEPIINLPWGSHFFINFIIPIKHERPVVGNIRPVSYFIKWGLWFDTWWTIKMLYRALKYFISTRFSKSRYRSSNIVTTLKILKQLQAYSPMIDQAKEYLESNPDIHTLILGHTHSPIYRKFENDQEFVNSGTWTEVTSLDLSTLGKFSKLTYVFIDYQTPGRPRAQLRQWRGKWHHHELHSIV